MKGKVIWISLILLSAIIFLSSVLAHGGERAQELQADDIVAEILERQGVDSVKNLDCSAVAEEDFERLGEAAMSYMHPDEDQHKAMDEMMGGEGSESLRQAHIQMGKRFLGCEESVDGFMGMMGRGFGMMGDGMFADDQGMMGDRGFGGMMGFGMGAGMALGGFVTFITWLALMIFLILGSIYFWKEIKGKK